jgi:putative ABC transport system permease protein
MIRHFLLSAFGSIRKAPFTTTANLLTLALGLACFIAAYGVGQYWRSGDSYHENASRTFLMGQSLSRIDQPKPNPLNARSTAAIGPLLRQDFPGIERLARVYPLPDVAVAAGASKVALNSAYAESDFLKMFDLDFVAGDPRGALDRPGSVILTEDAAARLFGSAPAMGQRVLIGGSTEATVTGVIRPIRQPSFMGAGPDATIRFDMLAHYNVSPFGALRDANPLWVGTQGWCFIMLKPGFDVAQINQQMPAFVLRHMPEQNRRSLKMELEAYPVSEMAERQLNLTLLQNNDLNLTVVAILMGLGALTLGVAAINYANLATAQAAARSKEIGMRKTVGATRLLVIAQSWFETFLQSLVALGLALAILWAAAPAIRSMAGVDALFFLAQGALPWAMIAGLVAAVSLLAGLYPALVLSGVRPVQALRSGRSRAGPKFVARILVAVQFATASFLLIMLSVTQMQQAYMRSQALAAQDDPIVVLSDIMSANITYDALQAALAREPLVKSMTVSDRLPWTSGSSMVQLARTAQDSSTENQTLLKNVGYDYFQTLGLRTLAGRTFDRNRDTVSRSIVPLNAAQPIPVVIDATQAGALGFANPQDAVDKIVYLPPSFTRMFSDGASAPVQIIGVVEADRARVPVIPASGNMYAFAPDSPLQRQAFPVVRIDHRDVSGAIAAINRVWDRLSPNTPAGVRYYDDLFAFAYRQHGQISQLFILLASTAFVIASVGLLGIAVHVAGRRRHEVAVRKTLGSSAGRVVRLMLGDFSRPVIVGNLIAWPLGYFAANAYLAAFAYRIQLDALPFIASAAITIAIAWIAVIGVVLKSAMLRPAEVLRHA